MFTVNRFVVHYTKVFHCDLMKATQIKTKINDNFVCFKK